MSSASVIRRRLASSVAATACRRATHAAGAEIGLDHLRVRPAPAAARAGRDHAAIVEHGDVVGHGHHHLDVVLDQDHRDAAVGEQADQRLEVLDLAVGQARRRLVEQQQLRPQRQRARDLEPALVAERQVARLLLGIVGEADEVQQLARLREEARAPRGRSAAAAAASRRACCDSADGSRPARSPARVIWPNSSVFWNVRAMPRRASSWLGWPAMLAAEERDASRRSARRSRRSG